MALPDDTHTTFPVTSEQGHIPTDTPPIEYPINGIVVVGVIGRSEVDTSQLLDRILDSYIFGSRSYEPCVDSTFPFIFPEALKKEDDSSTLNKRVNTLATERPRQQHVLQSEQGKVLGALDTESNVLQNPKAPKRLDWMQKRLKYYHDEEKGYVYVQFAWGSRPSEIISKSVGIDGLPSAMEECERSILRGLLYMFSVRNIPFLCYFVAYLYY